ncbi:MAG: DUF1015 domain-containing protein [Deltaproteobacteria bacterium]|jgi:uncharacterized protein (DUF1015 family)|nr:DUF1015 domain-containing protein [Deltaproteobacteria bacterium]
MAEIRPLRAWRYSEPLMENISELISPLFDVASEKQKAALYENPYNSIHLSIPCGDCPPEDAARILQQWRDEGCIQHDSDPSIYVYYQYFRLPGDPKQYCRKGFICKIRIYDWDDNVILRHENTMPRSVNEQVALLAATRLNVSPTHGLYTDKNFELEADMDQSMQQPICQTESYQGTRDVLSVIREPREIKRFVRLMASKQVILADGHHRYAGSLTYMKQQTAANPNHSGNERYNFHLMWLTNTEAEDLRILPTHRLIKGLEIFDETTVLDKLDRHFIVKPVPDPDNVNEVIVGKKWTFGLIFKDNAYQISLKPDAHREMKWNFPPAIRALDLTVLHYFVIQEILGIQGRDQSSSNCIEYERSFSACLTKVIQGVCQMALITNEVSISDVKTVCRSGCTLPQKSTYFWPKVICGLVFSSL